MKHSRVVPPIFQVFIILVAITFLISISLLLIPSEQATASPMLQATATPTCPVPTCASQPVARHHGYQPRRYRLRGLFNATTSNISYTLPYSQIANGLTPEYGGDGITYINVTPVYPIPSLVVRGMAWQESQWKQFAENIYSDHDETQFCTFVATDCGYGITQITWCIINPSDPGCTWMDTEQVSQSLEYNLQSGTSWLIAQWNSPSNPFIGWNDHTVPEDWYYAVTAFNSWDE